jgi:hypothetical protein
MLSSTSIQGEDELHTSAAASAASDDEPAITDNNPAANEDAQYCLHLDSNRCWAEFFFKFF